MSDKIDRWDIAEGIEDGIVYRPDTGALVEYADHVARMEEAQATITEQAKMIEHLRGGPTPLYTAVDMANAARDGFRDGAASKSEPCDACFMAEAEALRKDADLGRVAIKFIDRLCDPAGSDPLEKIVEEYTAAFREAMSKEG